MADTAYAVQVPHALAPAQHGRGAFTLYLVTVTARTRGSVTVQLPRTMSWSCEKRFSDFALLRSALDAAAATGGLPLFPPKVWLGDSLDDALVESRRQRLNDWLQRAAALPDPAAAAPLAAFLEQPEELLMSSDEEGPADEEEDAERTQRRRLAVLAEARRLFPDVHDTSAVTARALLDFLHQNVEPSYLRSRCLDGQPELVARSCPRGRVVRAYKRLIEKLGADAGAPAAPRAARSVVGTSPTTEQQLPSEWHLWHHSRRRPAVHEWSRFTDTESIEAYYHKPTGMVTYEHVMLAGKIDRIATLRGQMQRAEDTDSTATEKTESLAMEKQLLELEIAQIAEAAQLEAQVLALRKQRAQNKATTLTLATTAAVQRKGLGEPALVVPDKLYLDLLPSIKGLLAISNFQRQQTGSWSSATGGLLKVELEPEPEPELDLSTAKLDLTGKWVLAATEGMDDFLQKLDVGYVKRSIATKVVNSLNGKLRIEIEQMGDNITFTSFAPSNPDGAANTFVIGKADNINENAFLGKMTADMHWEVSDAGEAALVADMVGEDGKTAQLRRTLIAGAEPEILVMETIADGGSMRQRFECEERPRRPVVLVAIVKTDTTSEMDSHDALGDIAGPSSVREDEEQGETPQLQNTSLKGSRKEEELAPQLERVTVHMDYIQSKFPWPLSNRDMTIATCARNLADGRWMMMTAGIVHPLHLPGEGSFARQVMNHWVVLEQCGPDTLLTIVAMLDMGGDIPSAIISMAIGEMGAFFSNLQSYMDSDTNQGRIQNLVEGAQLESSGIDTGDNRSLAQDAIEANVQRSDDMLSNGWIEGKPISGGIAVMSRKPVTGVAIDPVRCIGYVRNVKADILRLVMADPVAKRTLSEMTPSPILHFERMESHQIDLPTVDLTEYVRTQPAPEAEAEVQVAPPQLSAPQRLPNVTPPTEEQGNAADLMSKEETLETPPPGDIIAVPSGEEGMPLATTVEEAEPTAYHTPTGQRQILDEDQLDALRVLRELFPQQRYHTLCRWLKASEFDREVAATELRRHLAWRETTLPIGVNAAIKRLCVGINAPIKRLPNCCVDGSKTIVISARFLPPPSPEAIDILTLATIFQVDAALEEESAVPGSKPSNLSVIYDRRGDVSTSSELDYAKPIVGVLESHYPETLSRAFLFPISGAFRFAWGVASMMFDEDTRRKLVLTSDPAEIQLWTGSAMDRV